MLYIAVFLFGLGWGVILGAAIARKVRRKSAEVEWRKHEAPPVVVVAPGTDPEAPVQSTEQEDHPVILDAAYTRPNMPGSNSKME